MSEREGSARARLVALRGLAARRRALVAAHLAECQACWQARRGGGAPCQQGARLRRAWVEAERLYHRAFEGLIDHLEASDYLFEAASMIELAVRIAARYGFRPLAVLATLQEELAKEAQVLKDWEGSR